MDTVRDVVMLSLFGGQGVYHAVPARGKNNFGREEVQFFTDTLLIDPLAKAEV